jgi:ABC-type nitrate/sulfonate/bicarbonate transport system permease component
VNSNDRPASGPRALSRYSRHIRLRDSGAANVLGWLLLIAFVIIVWWLAVDISGAAVIVAPPPGRVVEDILSAPDLYAVATLQTVLDALGGLTIGVAIACLSAVVTWWSATLAGVVRPAVYLAQAVPLVALIPIVNQITSYGSSTGIIICALATFFPSYVLVASALRAASRRSWNVAAALGSTRGQLLRYVALPAAVPAFFVALQVSATLSILAAFGTEYLVGSSGLGGLFSMVRGNYMYPARTWGVAVVATILSCITFGVTVLATRAIERRFR